MRLRVRQEPGEGVRDVAHLILWSNLGAATGSGRETEVDCGHSVAALQPPRDKGGCGFREVGLVSPHPAPTVHEEDQRAGVAVVEPVEVQLRHRGIPAGGQGVRELLEREHGRGCRIESSLDALGGGRIGRTARQEQEYS
mgnify:CR=1 FL=1